MLVIILIVVSELPVSAYVMFVFVKCKNYKPPKIDEITIVLNNWGTDLETI